jgi:hypothetical protein
VCEVCSGVERDLIAGMGCLLRGLDELTKLGVPLRYDGLILGGAGQGCTGCIVFRHGHHNISSLVRSRWLECC